MSQGPYDDGTRMGGGRSYAIASLVLGIISLPLILMPPGATYLGTSAVVGSILAMRRGGRQAMAVAGGVLGSIAVLIGTFLAVGLCGPSILWFDCQA